MAQDEVSIKIQNMGTEQFNRSLEALEAHYPAPVITVHVSLNTSTEDDEDGIDLRSYFRALKAVADDFGITYTGTLKGKWDAEKSSDQLRLFPPDELPDVGPMLRDVM